jgi:hypothetical protein
MRVNATIRIEKAGLDYMLYSAENNVVGAIADACNSKRKSSWIDAKKRWAIHLEGGSWNQKKEHTFSIPTRASNRMSRF